MEEEAEKDNVGLGGDGVASDLDILTKNPRDDGHTLVQPGS